MTTEIIRIAGVALIGSILAVVLRQYRPEYAVAAGVVTSLIIVSMVVAELVPMAESLGGLIRRTNLPTGYLPVVWKSMGICLIAQFAGDACRSAGEPGIAGKVEFAARVAVMLLALPMMLDVAEIALELISGV